MNSIDGATLGARQPVAIRHVKPSAPPIFINAIDVQLDMKSFSAGMLGCRFLHYGSAPPQRASRVDEIQFYSLDLALQLPSPLTGES